MFVKYLVGSPYLLCSPGWILIGFTTLTISQKTPPITHPGLMIFPQIPNTHIYTGLSENGLSSVSLYTCPFCGIPYFQTHSYASQTKSIINLKQSKRTWTCHKSNFLRKFTEKCRTPEWAPWSSTGLYTYCKNPSVWTHCLEKKVLASRNLAIKSGKIWRFITKRMTVLKHRVSSKQTVGPYAMLRCFLRNWTPTNNWIGICPAKIKKNDQTSGYPATHLGMVETMFIDMHTI
jgi:hypothetical protein